MDINPDEFAFFLQTIDYSLDTVSVHEEDRDSFRDKLNSTFGYRCASPAQIIPDTHEVPQQICIQNTCPLGEPASDGCSGSAAAPGYTAIAAMTATPGSAHSLSTGAKTGVGVGLGAVVVILLLSGFFLFRRRFRITRHASDSKRNKDQLAELAGAATATEAKARPELEGDNALEAGSNQVYEMDGVGKVIRPSVA